VHELALEAYRASRTKRRDWQRLVRLLLRAIDDSAKIDLSDIDIDPTISSYSHFVISRFLDYWAHQPPGAASSFRRATEE